VIHYTVNQNLKYASCVCHYIPHGLEINLLSLFLQKNDFSRVSTSNETPAVSSNQNSQLFDATSVELMKKRLHEFLAK
jgi:hypothetical protein